MNVSKLKSRYSGIQTRLKEIGNYGCLFLSICSIIEEFTGKEADIIGIVQESMARGWLERDFTVSSSIEILTAFTGKRWSRRIVQKLPDTIADNEYTVEKWLNPNTNGNHFRRRFVDTLIDSKTVKIGRIVAYYIYSYE